MDNRTFVISDIHGNLALFEKALQFMALQPSDTLVLLGDLIDRGPDTKGVLDTVINLKEQGLDVQLVKGNHEALFLDAFSSSKSLMRWMLNGGDRMLASFETGHIQHIPKKYVELLDSAALYLEIGNYILVHAALNMTIEDPFSDEFTMLWHRKPLELLNKEWLGNRTVVHGHTPTKEDILKSELSNVIIGIDNGTYLKEKEGFGALPVLELNTRQLTFIK